MKLISPLTSVIAGFNCSLLKNFLSRATRPIGHSVARSVRVTSYQPTDRIDQLSYDNKNETKVMDVTKAGGLVRHLLT